mmetsp:Transcript_683/g.2295  ORF Transcript_683/g.2295 Transcript_683/m.2295 type:complete len:375 (-) Transcript_683:146-1270(-)
MAYGQLVSTTDDTAASAVARGASFPAPVSFTAVFPFETLFWLVPQPSRRLLWFKSARLYSTTNTLPSVSPQKTLRPTQSRHIVFNRDGIQAGDSTFADVSPVLALSIDKLRAARATKTTFGFIGWKLTPTTGTAFFVLVPVGGLEPSHDSLASPHRITRAHVHLFVVSPFVSPTRPVSPAVSPVSPVATALHRRTSPSLDPVTKRSSFGDQPIDVIRVTCPTSVATVLKRNLFDESVSVSFKIPVSTRDAIRISTTPSALPSATEKVESAVFLSWCPERWLHLATVTPARRAPVVLASFVCCGASQIRCCASTVACVKTFWRLVALDGAGVPWARFTGIVDEADALVVSATAGAASFLRTRPSFAPTSAKRNDE